MSDKRHLVDIKAWIDMNAKIIAKEHSKLIKVLCSDKKPEVATELMYKVFGEILLTALNEALDVNPIKEMSNHDQYNITCQKLMHAKDTVQAEVSDKFGRALSAFTGTPVEYYVVIKPEPKPLSKAVN